MCPYRSWRSRIATSASTRSRAASPIPMSTPVVNGMPSLHARAIPGRPGGGAWAAPVRAESAAARVVAAEGRERHEDFAGEGDGAATAAVANLARSGQEIAERARASLDEGARVLMRNHFRRA